MYVSSLAQRHWGSLFPVAEQFRATQLRRAGERGVERGNGRCGHYNEQEVEDPRADGLGNFCWDSSLDAAKGSPVKVTLGADTSFNALR